MWARLPSGLKNRYPGTKGKGLKISNTRQRTRKNVTLFGDGIIMVNIYLNMIGQIAEERGGSIYVILNFTGTPLSQ
jgi:hypothetical protein